MFLHKSNPTHLPLSQLSLLSTELNILNICFKREIETYTPYRLELSAHPTHPATTRKAGNA